jgi:hypothetical protein
MFTVLYFIVFLTTHYILFIILLHAVGKAYSTPPSFVVSFCFSIFAITMVLVWCVFLQLRIGVNAVDPFPFEIVQLGGGGGGDFKSCFEGFVFFFQTIFRYFFTL